MRGLLLVVIVAAASSARGADRSSSAGYFPLRVGNWWSYEEQDDDGKALSRETWLLVEEGDAHAGEFHLRSSAKRLDALGGVQKHWVVNEYLRATGDGVHKRYPAGREAEVDVMLFHEPATAGTQWRDAQGRCEVVSEGTPCAGPRGELPRCLVIVCRLGDPAATIVTSTYASGIGMVRQDVEVVQLVPGLGGGSPAGLLPADVSKGGRSTLRLTGYHVTSP